jgi:hypothetical protein
MEYLMKINIAVCNWQNEGFVTNEDYDITMKYGALISICLKVQNQADRIYIYGVSLKGCEGIFYWYHPQSLNHHCERIRLFLSTYENDCYLTGEVWVCLDSGPYQIETSGKNHMTFRWP